MTSFLDIESDVWLIILTAVIVIETLALIVLTLVLVKREKKEVDTNSLVKTLEKVLVFPAQLLKEKLAMAEERLERTQGIVSKKNDTEDLRSIWSDILQVEKDKLDDLKKRITNLKTSELDSIEQGASDLIERLVFLEKYGKDYLSERALEEFTNEVKDYMPREDVTCQDIYKGLADSLVTELKNCLGKENEGKIIKEGIAKLVYSKL